jgi:serine phosphatase RsbU (regulator of sigma subunit)
VRHRQASPDRLVEQLVGAVSAWSGAAELSDDMTVLVARID